MKKSFIYLLCFSLSFSGVAGVHCQNTSTEDGDDFQKCHNYQEDNNSERRASPCPDPNKVEDNKVLSESGISSDSPLTCNDDDLFEGIKKEDRPNKKQLVKEYTKQCKKKAKKYKKAVFKKLLKQFKLGQAFQALFKRKKNIYKARAKSARRQNVSADLDPSELENMSQKEINDHIMNKLDQKVPGLKDAVSKMTSQDQGLSEGFHETETIPMNIVVDKKGRNACTVNVESAPEREPYSPEQCEFCQGKDIKNSFVDDCAYMTASNFSESDALKVVNSNSRKRTDYCQPSMENRNSDMGQIDSMAKNLCDIAKKGLAPDFDIETTRNLYNDKTENLAGKRGEFIQNYLRKKIKKDCELEDEPDWLSDKESFANKVRVSHPSYEGLNKSGDYGPNPYATEDQQQKEVENLGKTMKSEKENLIAKRDKKLAKISSIKSNLEAINSDIAALNNKYSELKVELEKTTEVGKMNLIYKDISTVSNSIHDLHNSQDRLDQDVNDSQQMIQGFNERIRKYSDIRIQRKQEQLSAYYKDKKENPSFSKAEWDKKLFNDFKMVRISGKAVEDHGIPSIEDGLSPELSVALNAMIRMDQFTCTMEPITTHKTKFSGALKVLGKVGLAIASPIVLGVGTGLAVAASPITTTASLFCQGCGKPGSTMPRWMMFGNPRALNLKKGWPKRLKKDIGNGVETYFNLGGALKIKKGDREYTEHSFDEFQ
ncbi:MAG: hypothetical protein KC493_08730 [Bacteriovoracaceae bacterium]|nr:hypothetical protein [Bacteriovoracaceae bacterium]